MKTYNQQPMSLKLVNYLRENVFMVLRDVAVSCGNKFMKKFKHTTKIHDISNSFAVENNVQNLENSEQISEEVDLNQDSELNQVVLLNGKVVLNEEAENINSNEQGGREINSSLKIRTISYSDEVNDTQEIAVQRPCKRIRNISSSDDEGIIQKLVKLNDENELENINDEATQQFLVQKKENQNGNSHEASENNRKPARSEAGNSKCKAENVKSNEQVGMSQLFTEPSLPAKITKSAIPMEVADMEATQLFAKLKEPGSNTKKEETSKFVKKNQNSAGDGVQMAVTTNHVFHVSNDPFEIPETQTDPLRTEGFVAIPEEETPMNDGSKSLDLLLCGVSLFVTQQINVTQEDGTEDGTEDEILSKENSKDAFDDVGIENKRDFEDTDDFHLHDTAGLEMPTLNWDDTTNEGDKSASVQPDLNFDLLSSNEANQVTSNTDSRSEDIDLSAGANGKENAIPMDMDVEATRLFNKPKAPGSNTKMMSNVTDHDFDDTQLFVNPDGNDEILEDLCAPKGSAFSTSRLKHQNRNETITKMQLTIDDLNDVKERLSVKCAYVESQYKKSIEDTNYLHAKLEELTSEKEKKLQQIEGLEKTIKEFQEYINGMNSKPLTLDTSCDNLDDSYAIAESSATNLQLLRVELDSLSSKNSSLENQLQGCEQEIVVLKANNKAIAAENAVHLHHLEMLQEQIKQSDEQRATSVRPTLKRKHSASYDEDDLTLKQPKVSQNIDPEAIKDKKILIGTIKEETTNDSKQPLRNLRSNKSVTNSAVSHGTTNDTKQPLRNLRSNKSVSYSAVSHVLSDENENIKKKSIKDDDFSSSFNRTSRNRHISVMFTMISTKQYESQLKELNIKLVEADQTYDILITNRIYRSPKFMCALASGKPIVSTKWLESLQKHKTMPDPFKFLLDDKDGEAKYKFSLAKTLGKVNSLGRLFQRHSILVTPTTSPNPEILKGIIESAGGKYLKTCYVPRKHDMVLAVSDNADATMLRKLKKKYPDLKDVISGEGLLQAIFQYNINVKGYKI